MTEVRPPDRLQTLRLLLRRPTIEDARMVFEAYAQDAAVAKYMTWTPHEHIEETREFLRECVAGWEQGTRFTWLLLRMSDATLIGVVDVRLAPPESDIGYLTVREHWRKGYMTEALRALIAWARAQPEIDSVSAVCDVENIASAGLLTSLGFSSEGILENHMLHPNMSSVPRDCLKFTLR